MANIEQHDAQPELDRLRQENEQLRAQLEACHRQENERELLADLVGSITDGLLALDRDWNFLYINERAARNGNRDPQDLIGKNIWQEFPGLVGTDLDGAYRRVMAERRPEHVRWNSAGLRIASYDVSVYPTRSGIAVYWLDKTAQVRAERELLENKERLDQVLDAAGMGTWVYDPLTDMVVYDERAQALYGAPAGPIDHSQFSAGRLHPDDLPRMQAALEAALRPDGDGAYQIIYRFRREDGGWRWLHAWGKTQRDEDGRPLRLVGSARDITDMKRIEADLELQTHLIDLSYEPVFIWDLQSGIQMWNQGCERLYGYPKAEVLGRSSHELLATQHPGGLEAFRAGLRASGRWSGEVQHRARDGRLLTVESRQDLLRVDGRELVLETNRDITARKAAEAALEQHRDLLQAIIDNAATAIYAKDMQGRFIISNRSHAGLLGCSTAEVLGKTDEYFGISAPRAAEYRANDARVAARGRAVEFEEIVPDPLGHEHTYLSVKFPLRAPDGSIYGVCGISTDITARKQSEATLNRYAAQMAKLNRELSFANRELKDFAHIASHDLQEPLRKVTQFGGMLRDRYGATLAGDGVVYIDRMIDAARRMQEMINGLLDYSRISTRGNPFAPVDLARVAGEVLTDLEIRIEQSGGQVTVGELPQIEADPLQMRQLLQNLIGNALKFHRPGQPPRVRVWAEEAPGGEDYPDSIRLVVADEGIGFEEQHLDKLFLPYVRLHGRSEYEGTGMGLAICRKIADRHGGAISARSTPGQGSVFTVRLPRAQRKEPGIEPA